MKKNVIRGLMLGLVAAVTMLMSSCIICVDGSAEVENTVEYGQIEIVNECNPKYCYIDSVYVRGYGESKWSLLWSKGDSDGCWFNVPEGYYALRIYAAYPDYYHKTETYDVIETSGLNRVCVDGGYRTVIYFDGSDIYEEK